jgi:hypothetical protein
VDYELPPLVPVASDPRLPAGTVAPLLEKAGICRDTGMAFDHVRLMENRADVEIDAAAGNPLAEAHALARSRLIRDFSDALCWMLIDATADLAISASRLGRAVVSGTAPDPSDWPSDRTAPDPSGWPSDGAALFEDGAVPLLQVGSSHDGLLRETHGRLGKVLDALRGRGDLARLFRERGPIGEPWLLELPDAAHAYGHECCYALSWYLRSGAGREPAEQTSAHRRRAAGGVPQPR